MQTRLERVRSLLRSETTLVLATVDDDQAPRSTPLFYVAPAAGLKNEAPRLFWFSSPASMHSRNCARQPAAAAAVFAPAGRWQQIRGAQLWGRVAAVADPELRTRIEREYCQRFALGKSLAPAMRRASLYCFTPVRVRCIENVRRFGEKFEISFEKKQAQSAGRQ
jgi:uncharacterized protein YhbP (UPF0306 family)